MPPSIRPIPTMDPGACRTRGDWRPSTVAMRRFWLALVFALLTACTGHSLGVSSRPTSSLPGAPPRVVASDLFLCPGGYGWAGYRDVVYAPNEPSKPAADVRPERCFASLEDATRAGFHLPPPPPGGALIETIYLVPPDPSIVPVCQEAARHLG